MAKRRRLIPSPQIAGTGLDDIGSESRLETKSALRPTISAPPIAHVAAEASTRAALDELSDAMGRARLEGRLVLSLGLEAVDPNYLVRDRLASEGEEMEALLASIRDHGQRAPIEVVDLSEGRYGLISGWRRFQALRRLSLEGPEPRLVQALLRRPETDSDAYVAMVEENEIRQGLSYYERARIAAKAVDLGVFETEKAALQRLFAASSRARRSKIGSFLSLYRKLDDVLRYPSAISERLGLALEKAFELDAARLADLRAALSAAEPESAEAELQILTRYSSAKTGSNRPTEPKSDTRQEIRPGVFLEVSGGYLKPVLTLSGPKVGPDFREELENWLAARG